MKKHFFKTLLAVSVFVGLLSLMCCKPEKTTTPTPINVGFHFHTFIDSTLLDPVVYPSQWVVDNAGRNLNLSTAQFYITNISIHIIGTGWVSPDAGLVMMKRINNEIYPVGTIPAPPSGSSNYIDSVKFTVGLSNTLNAQPPSSYPTTSSLDSVLSTNEQTAMWGSSMTGMASMASISGYTFMNIQGYDSSGAYNGNINYQIGGYGDTVNVVLGYAGGFNFVPVLTGTNLNLIHIIADYGTLLNAINTINSSNANSQFWNSANSAASLQLLNNIKNMFRFECGPPINC